MSYSLWDLPPKSRAYVQHMKTVKAARTARRAFSRDVIHIEPTPAVAPLVTIPDNLPTRKRIVFECARDYRVEPQQVLGLSRSVEIVRARHAAMYRMSVEMGASNSQIGRWLNRDATTVLSGIRAHKKRQGIAP